MHAEIPHAKLGPLLDHAAVKHRVAVIRRPLGAAAQHGIIRVLCRGNQGDFQIVLPGDVVIVEGEEDLLFSVGQCKTPSAGKGKG